MPVIRFTVPGQPIAKQRHRGAALQQCKKCGRKTARRMCLCGSQELSYLTTLETTPRETRVYENLVALQAQAALGEAGLGALVTGPCVLRVAFYFEIPPSRAKKLKEGDPHSQRPDLDNCIKSVEDGMNKVLLHDDSSIWRVEAEKRWSNQPRAEVEVETA